MRVCLRRGTLSLLSRHFAMQCLGPNKKPTYSKKSRSNRNNNYSIDKISTTSKACPLKKGKHLCAMSSKENALWEATNRSEASLHISASPRLEKLTQQTLWRGLLSRMDPCSSDLNPSTPRGTTDATWAGPRLRREHKLFSIKEESTKGKKL